MKKIVLSLAIASAFGFAGSYVTPAEYDNMRLSQQSTGYEIIHNSSSLLSTNSFKIGGRTLKYKCIPVTKIDCRAGTPEIVPAVSEVGLKVGPNDNVVPIYAYDMRVEDDTANNRFKICAAAYGGVTADKSELTSSTDPVTGDVTLDYTYVPNDPSKSYFWWFLTNAAATEVGNATSYISVRWKQVCR